MIDLDVNPDPVWPGHLKPRGEGTSDKEDFAAWWFRHRGELAHIDPNLCEQWIHRHWKHSPFAYLPLGTLTWRRETVSGEHILLSVHRKFASTLNPDFDYATFQPMGNWKKHPTSAALDTGTWDYPIIVLSTPTGIRSRDRVLPDVRLVLVEGHQRHRYLNALHKLGRAPSGPHDIFIIESPLATSALAI